jgi:ATP-binding cassette subfamily B (MDR/TAP) protein 1
MQMAYLRSVLSQDVGAFDTDLTTAYIMAGATNHMKVIQDAIGEKVSICISKHSLHVAVIATAAQNVCSIITNSIHGLTNFFPQMGHFISNFSTFLVAIIIAFVCCWEVGMMSFLVVPMLLVIGATYAKMMIGMSITRIALVSEATSVVEQVPMQLNAPLEVKY